MYEGMTFDFILEKMLKNVPKDIDKREGSIIYDAVAPAAAELAQLYIELDCVLTETFADTAGRQYLVMRAAERGIEPYSSAKAVCRAVFNIDIPIGSRFSLDKFNYTATELISSDDHSYKLECETAGREPNGFTGTLVPIQYLEGLETAEITEVIIPGEDEEETEAFRKRYFNSLSSQSFGGNVIEYKQKVSAVQGVGGVKVYPVWNGGGTVKVVITDSENKKPSAELINSVQTTVDPEQNHGEGMGIAPIGHIVTVEGVTETAINLVFNISLAEEWTWEDIKPHIEEVIDKYFTELNSSWDESGNIIVRISQLESRILELVGIVDIADTTINGEAKNYIADENSILVRGSVSNA
ncbi:baseplate J/gp47 family protein [Lachnospiraceae bacterium NSJ-143]|nr:baseplate J/gp47 family protein [Lachnospiraceae bacterium NSJ-143]